MYVLLPLAVVQATMKRSGAVILDGNLSYDHIVNIQWFSRTLLVYESLLYSGRFKITYVHAAYVN